MEINKIAEKVKKKGGTLYLVGGAIRDELLGKEPKDKDYCITGLTKDEFIELFPNAFLRGKSFPVFDIDKTEFSLARKEEKIQAGHKGFEIETGKDITIYEDLERRDITINSMAQEVLTGKMIDPYNGREDIKNKMIRATSNKFCEDPLRAYRVARFSSNLEFQVEPSTINLIYQIKKELNTLSKERVMEEFKKGLESKKPSLFFEVLRKANILDVHFKEIENLIGSLQPEKYHPEGDSYVHTMQVLDKVSQMTEKLEIRFGGLVHDLGKGVTPKELYPHHYGHDKNGIQEVKNLCNRIGAPGVWEKCGITASKEHMLGGNFFTLRPGKQVDFLERAEKTWLGLKGLQIIVDADKYGKENREIDFVRIGRRCLEEINGEYIKEKYHLEEGLKLKERLHEERVIWMKNNRK